MKTVSIIGSTGSVGKSGISVIKKNKSLFKVRFIVAKNNYKLLAQQALEVNPEYVAIQNSSYVKKLEEEINNLFASAQKPKIIDGIDEIESLIKDNIEEHILLSSCGYESISYFWHLINNKNKVIALANKESIICATEAYKTQIIKAKDRIIPVDSEHSSLFQLLEGRNTNDINKYYLTASGGPFLNHTQKDLEKVTVKEALNHPTWSMGGKISIDSATLVNKALEVIEAVYLFNIKSEDVEVLIHPQSIIHGAVSFKDGSFISNLYNPSMEVPVSYGFSYPVRCSTNVKALNLEEIGSLNFIKMNDAQKNIINMAKSCVNKGLSYPCAFSVINEVLVKLFIEGKISFLQISSLLDEFLNKVEIKNLNNLSDILEYCEYIHNYIHTELHIK